MAGEKVKKITPENSNTGRVYYTVRGERIAVSDENEKTNNVFGGIIAINIFVVICIFILLFGVRLIIIKPLLDKK